MSHVAQAAPDLRKESPQAASPLSCPIPEKPAAPISVERPATVPSEKPISRVAPVPKLPVAVPPSALPELEPKPEFAAKQEPPRFCAWCGTVHAGGVENCPTSAPVVRPAEGPPSKQPVASDVRLPAKQEQAPVARAAKRPSPCGTPRRRSWTARSARPSKPLRGSLAPSAAWPSCSLRAWFCSRRSGS